MENKLILEVRPRLGAANCYAMVSSKAIKEVSVESSRILLSPEDISFYWPSKFYGNISNEDIHNCQFSDNGVTFRITLNRDIVSVINPHQDLKVKKTFRKPCQIPDFADAELDLKCSKCDYSNAAVKIKRILPLPSIDWRGGIQDWFCSCSHGVTSECSTVKNGQSNRKLHEKELGPRDGDLLFSHSFVCLHSNLFEPVVEGKVLCKSCKAHLGDNIEKQKSVQLWHHSVVFGDNNGSSKVAAVKSSEEETFLLLIGGICVEHDWMPIKIKLCSTSERTLFLWIMEPDLHLVTLTSSHFTDTSVMKVLYSADKNCIAPDQEIDTPDEVLAAAFQHLDSNQELIPLGQRNDSNMKISYINFSSVIVAP